MTTKLRGEYGMAQQCHDYSMDSHQRRLSCQYGEFGRGAFSVPDALCRIQDTEYLYILLLAGRIDLFFRAISPSLYFPLPDRSNHCTTAEFRAS